MKPGPVTVFSCIIMRRSSSGVIKPNNDNFELISVFGKFVSAQNVPDSTFTTSDFTGSHSEEFEELSRLQVERRGSCDDVYDNVMEICAAIFFMFVLFSTVQPSFYKVKENFCFNFVRLRDDKDKSSELERKKVIHRKKIKRVKKVDVEKRRLELVDSGNTTVVYKVLNERNVAMSIFKPYTKHEFPEKFNLSSIKQIFNEVAAYVLDDNVRSLGISANVPETSLSSVFYDVVKTKLYGSVQSFVPNAESCEDFGYNLFPGDQIHKIGILDIRILNLDRHTGNILLLNQNEKDSNQTAKGMSLVPIDHAYSFPTLEDVKNVNFEWLFFPQTKEPFSVEILNGIAAIDVDKDIDRLNVLSNSVTVGENDRLRFTFEQKALVFASTTLLKLAAGRGKSLFEIGHMIQRSFDANKRGEPSFFEALVSKSMDEASTPYVTAGTLEEDRQLFEKFQSVFVKNLNLSL